MFDICRNTPKVILTYDGDAAGQNAIAKSLEFLSDFSVDIVRIPDQMNHDEFIQKIHLKLWRNYFKRQELVQLNSSFTI